MAYTTPAGISVLNLATLEAKQVVAGPARAIVVGQKTPTVYFTRPTEDPFFSTLWCANLETGETRKLAALPRRAGVATINADETLAAGTFIEGDANAGGAYDGTAPTGRMSATNLGEPEDKGAMMRRRLAAKLPMTMFTIDLRTGAIKNLIEHSTDWLNHLQFSPADPTLLLYCHEGIWQLVDRIWTIRTDGSALTKIHTRTMNFEIAGHEFFSADGKWIWYDLQTPRGQVFWIAGHELATGRKLYRRVEQNEWSVHYNVAADGKLFSGDGGDADMVAHAPDGKWLYVFRPETIRDAATQFYTDDLISVDKMASERLVDMSAHDYRLEPNLSFTPDQKWIVFTSNMHGQNHVYAVEVDKHGA
jgi:oligogalacturonide lyase